MIVHLIDGTYELFRHFYGLRRSRKGRTRPFGAAVGVLNTVLQMIEDGATHIGVATDHVIESFRNDLWPGYKTGDGIEPALWASSIRSRTRSRRWASWRGRWSSSRPTMRWRRRRTSRRGIAVEKVCIWTPDKDLAQCVRGDRVVQVDRSAEDPRRRRRREKFGVEPRLSRIISRSSATARTAIPASRHRRGAAARLINRDGPIEDFPDDVLGRQSRSGVALQEARDAAHRRPVVQHRVDAEWRGPTPAIRGVWCATRGSARRGSRDRGHPALGRRHSQNHGAVRRVGLTSISPGPLSDADECGTRAQ